MVQISHPYMSIRKTIHLTIWTFVSKVSSLLLNILSTFVIAFHPRNKCLFISWLQSPSTVILEPKKVKSITVFIFPHLFFMCFIWWWSRFPAFSQQERYWGGAGKWNIWGIPAHGLDTEWGSVERHWEIPTHSKDTGWGADWVKANKQVIINPVERCWRKGTIEGNQGIPGLKGGSHMAPL